MLDVRADPHQERFIRAVTALCAALPAAMAIVVVVGWQMGLAPLTRVFPPSPRILPNSAAMIFLASAALGSLLVAESVPRARTTARVAAAGLASLGALLGLLTLAEHLGAPAPGVDTLLFSEEVARLGMRTPGRSSPHTSLAAGATCICLAIRAMVGPKALAHALRVSEALAAIGLLVAYLGLQGAVFDIPALHATPTAGMSGPMAVALALVAAGAILSCKGRGGAWFASAGPGGVVLRRLVPAALVVPPTLGWLTLEAERRGLFGENAGLALLSTSMMLVTMVLVGWIAVTVNRSTAEQEAYRDQLAANEERIRGLVESAPDGIVVVAQDGTILYVNTQLERMFHYSRTQLVGQKVELLVPDGLREKHRHHRSRYAGQPACRSEGERVAVMGRRSGGDFLEIEVSLSPIRRPGFNETLAVVRDLAERRKFESDQAAREFETARLRELASIKDHVLSSLSHEVKTPLSLILGYAELLEEDHPDDFRIEGILDGCKRLSAHINALLDYSALAAGGLPLYRTEVVIPELIRTAIEGWAPTIHSSGVHVETTISPHVPPVEGDTRRIAEVLDILLDNAFKFTPSGGVVRVEAFPCGDQACFRVLDSGPGIEPAIVARIWEPFGKAQIGAGGRGGLGLGLALARKLVEAHGGALDLQTEPGRGCAFTVQLPTLKSID